MAKSPVWVLDTPDLYWVPRRAEIARGIVGMDTPAIHQDAYALWSANTDPTSSTSPDLVSEQTSDNSHSLEAGTQFAIAFVAQEVNGADAANSQFQFQYAYKPSGGSFGSFTNITTSSSYVRAVDNTHTNATEGATTSNVLGGSGTFQGNENFTEDGLCGTLNSCDIAASGHAEPRCEVQLVSGDFSDGDAVQIRILHDGAVVASYDATPTINVTVSAQTLTGTVVNVAGVAYDGVLDNVQYAVDTGAPNVAGVAYDGVLTSEAFLIGAVVEQAGVAYDASILYEQFLTAAVVDQPAVAYDATLIWDQIITGLVVEQAGVAYDGSIVQPVLQISYASLESPDPGAQPQTITGEVAEAWPWAFDAEWQGAQDITHTAVDQPAVAYDATLVPGPATITGTVVEQAGVAYDGVAAPGNLNFSNATVDVPGVAYDGVLSSSATLQGTVVEQAAQGYDGVLQPGNVNVSNPTVDIPGVAYDGTLVPGEAILAGTAVLQDGVAYGGTVTQGEGIMIAGPLDDPGTAYDGVLVPGPRTLVGTVVTQDGVAYTAVLYSQAFLIPDGPVTLTREVFDATLIPGPVTLQGTVVDQPAVAYDAYIPHLIFGSGVDAPATAYDGVLVPGNVDLAASALDDPATAYDGVLTPGAVILTGTLVDQAGVAYDAVLSAVYRIQGLVVELAAIAYNGSWLGGDQQIFATPDNVDQATGVLDREDFRVVTLPREDFDTGTLHREDDR